MNLQYKMTLSGSWSDVPSYALMGVRDGALDLLYPEATERDGLGRPCGAIGKPTMTIRSPIMTSVGMAFWQGRFSNSAEVSASMWIAGYDIRTGSYTGTAAWSSVCGYLARPKYARVTVGGDDAAINQTIWRDIEITLYECESTTGPSYDSGSSWDYGTSVSTVTDGGAW